VLLRVFKVKETEKETKAADENRADSGKQHSF